MQCLYLLYKFIAFLGYHMIWIKMCPFVTKQISLFLRFHRIVLSQESVGEGSKNFLSEPAPSKTFWKLGCQVAALCAPSTILAECIFLIMGLSVEDIVLNY